MIHIHKRDPITMLAISWRVILENGLEVVAQTWTTGTCARTAWLDWKRAHPDMAARLVEKHVLVEPKKRDTTFAHVRRGRPVGYSPITQVERR